MEGAGSEVLGQAVAAEEPEEDGDKDAIDGAEDEGQVGAEAAGVEGGGGEAEGGECEERAGEAKIEGEKAEEVEEEGVHPCRQLDG